MAGHEDIAVTEQDRVRAAVAAIGRKLSEVTLPSLERCGFSPAEAISHPCVTGFGSWVPGCG